MEKLKHKPKSKPKPKPKPKPKLNVYEERIVRMMRRYYHPMRINSIADKSGIHWKTTAKHLRSLIRKKFVMKVIVDGKAHFQAI